MDYLYYLFVVLGFLAVVLFLEGLYLTWNSYRGPEATNIEKRLRALSAGAGGNGESKLIKQRLLADAPAMDHFLMTIPRVHLLDRMLQQSGLTMNVASYLGWTLLATVVGMGLAAFINLPMLSGMLMASFPWLYVRRGIHRRLEKVEQQMPEVLELMSRAMLAGHAFPSALKMVGDEMAEPAAGEFRIVFDEINYGISVPEALNNLAARVPSTDVSYFVISVLIQRETGGNLAELFGNLSTLIRERLKLQGSVRVLAAEGKLSAQILTALPFTLALVINFVNPGFLRVLWTDPMGLKIVGAAFILMLIGIFWMWRIIKIRI